MNLQQILDRARVNRNTFNSWRTKAPLRFLDQRLTAEGRDRFTDAHAVALVAVSRFSQMGVPIQRAESVVTELFPNIDDRMQDGINEPTWLSYYMEGPYMYGFSFGYGDVNDQRDLSEGKIVAAENATKSDLGGGATVRYSLNLQQIVQELAEPTAGNVAA